MASGANTTNSLPSLAPSSPFDTPYDHRSLLNVIGWLFTIISSLVVATRCGTRWAVSRSFGINDTCIIISLTLTIGSMVSITFRVMSGLGLLDWETGSADEVGKLQKAVYTFNILSILSQSFSKLSIIVFIRTLTPNELHQRISTVTAIITISWTTVAIFGLIFQCNSPDFWRFLHNKCINRLAFFTYVEVVNILLDAVLVVLPIFVLWKIQLKLKLKLMIMGCFLPRIFVVVALILQLAILYNKHKTTQSGSDPFAFWGFIITTEAIQCLGIISASVIYLKPFLQSLNTGMIGNDDLRRRGTQGPSFYTSKTKASSSRKVKNMIKSLTDHTSIALSSAAVGGSAPNFNKGIPLQNNPMKTDSWNEVCVTSERTGLEENDWDASSQSSRAKIIRQTKTFVATATDVRQ